VVVGSSPTFPIFWREVAQLVEHEKRPFDLVAVLSLTIDHLTKINNR
jgi:hypothetical protein